MTYPDVEGQLPSAEELEQRARRAVAKRNFAELADTAPTQAARDHWARKLKELNT